MKKNNFIKRLLVFICGLFAVALGVAFSVKADLGISPVSCIPYVYFLKYPLSMGETTIIFNVLLILIQIIILRKNYKPFQLIQIPMAFFFGFFTDFTLWLLTDIHPNSYAHKLILCLIGCICIGFGVFLEVSAKVTYLPGEGVALAISETFGPQFGKAKIGVDCSFVILCFFSSILLLHRIAGIREGTVIAALLVGYIARLLLRYVHIPEKIIPKPTTISDDEQKSKSSALPYMITIAREYGSGGHEIGKKLAHKLGYQFYDRKLIKLTAEKSGFTTEYIKEHEQKLAHTLLYDLYRQNYAYMNEKLPPMDALFLVQSKIIREIADQKPAVIVGRCSNFILKNRANCINIFIHASRDFRKQRAHSQYGIPVENLDKQISQTDNERANYCKLYTGNSWNNAIFYHLCIDSSTTGIDQAVELIEKVILQKQNKNSQ